MRKNSNRFLKGAGSCRCHKEISREGRGEEVQTTVCNCEKGGTLLGRPVQKEKGLAERRLKGKEKADLKEPGGHLSQQHKGNRVANFPRGGGQQRLYFEGKKEKVQTGRREKGTSPIFPKKARRSRHERVAEVASTPKKGREGKKRSERGKSLFLFQRIGREGRSRECEEGTGKKEPRTPSLGRRKIPQRRKKEKKAVNEGKGGKNLLF